MASDPLPFRKMHGCANDYVVVSAEAFDAAVGDGALVRALCDRRTGIGADGVLAVGVGEGAADLTMRMWNPDGSSSEMCGNGLRCAVRFARETGISTRDAGVAQTGAGPLAFAIYGRDTEWDIEVEIGVPTIVDPALVLSGLSLATAIPATTSLTVCAVRVGNPHAVAIVPDVDAVELASIGPRVETHAAFPNRTNFEVVEVRSRTHLRQRTWERGAGETLACGTGAAATLAAAVLAGTAERKATISLRGGDLQVRWDDSDRLWIRGPAVEAYAGAWPLLAHAATSVQP